jgi:hypothetical protein
MCMNVTKNVGVYVSVSVSEYGRIGKAELSKRK